MESSAMEAVLRARLGGLAGHGPTAVRASLEPLVELADKKTKDGVDIIKLPPILDWIVYSTEEWNGVLKDTNKSIKLFTLRLTALATKKEEIFIQLSQKGVYNNLLIFCNLAQEDPSMKHNLLEIFHMMTNHIPGVKYLLENNIWEDVIKYYYKNQTIYFSRIAMDFITSFVWKLNDFKFDDQCSTVISAILKPLIDYLPASNIIDDEENIMMDAKLSPTLNLTISILENVQHFGSTNTVIKSLSSLNIDEKLQNVFYLCRKSLLLGTISKLTLLVRFVKVCLNKGVNDEFTQSDVVEMCLAHNNLIRALIAKGDADNYLRVTNYCLIYISKIRNHHKISMLVEDEKGTIDFTNQVVVLSALPMLCTLRMGTNEFANLYIDKLVSIACEHTTRTVYVYRDFVKDRNDLSTSIKAIQYTIALKKYITKSQAVVIFQSFYYRLQEFVPKVDDVKNYVVIGINSCETSQLVSALLDAVYIYIEEFDIPWQDTVEVLCVYSFCTRIIKTSNLETKLTLQAFKLAQLTIKKFLSPNLALLVNTSDGSVIEEIGKIIYTKLHDACWDIRDSAMELLYVVADIAEFKFPAFQEQITNNNLPGLVVTLAIEDSESYVRASALRCLCVMVRIKVIWENHLQFLDLRSKMINILYNESEGLVRKEAANVMVNIYEYQKFLASSLDSVFITMFHSAVEDLHWEVQLAALEFWKKVIANQISHQGMIDGTFPPVTFSKENRKIVHLNDIEIKRRLKKFLNELALRGCLGVLLSCMDDESELDVMDKALEIINEILQLLEKYNLFDLDTVQDDKMLNRPVFDENFLKNNEEVAKIGIYRNKADVRSEPNEITMDNGQNSDVVIESIVNTKDVNLLVNVFNSENKDMGSSDADLMKEKFENKSNMFVEPTAFIKIVKEKNFRKIIDDKRKWTVHMSTDINSLFDDILGPMPTSDINAMDCY